MPVRIFKADGLENFPRLDTEINKWLATLPAGAKIKLLDSAFCNPPSGGTVFAVTIFYAPGDPLEPQ